MEGISIYPRDLEEAVEVLEAYCVNELEVYKKMEESTFIYKCDLPSHGHPLGEYMRNAWYLWWELNHEFPEFWPKEKPEILKWFNLRAFHDPKKICEVILKCFHRKIRGYSNWADYNAKRRI